VVTIMVLSLLPQADMPNVHMSDKINHTLAYGCVMLAGGLGFWLRRERVRLVGGLFLLGAAMELLQGLLPSRHMSLLDLAANVLGIAAGLLLSALLTHRLLSRRPDRA